MGKELGFHFQAPNEVASHLSWLYTTLAGSPPWANSVAYAVTKSPYFIHTFHIYIGKFLRTLRKLVLRLSHICRKDFVYP